MTHPDAELARLAWEKRHATSLEKYLRENPDVRAKAKANGWWIDIIARIEEGEER